MIIISGVANQRTKAAAKLHGFPGLESQATVHAHALLVVLPVEPGWFWSGCSSSGQDSFAHLVNLNIVGMVTYQWHFGS